MFSDWNPSVEDSCRIKQNSIHGFISFIPMTLIKFASWKSWSLKIYEKSLDVHHCSILINVHQVSGRSSSSLLHPYHISAGAVRHHSPAHTPPASSAAGAGPGSESRRRRSSESTPQGSQPQLADALFSKKNGIVRISWGYVSNGMATARNVGTAGWIFFINFAHRVKAHNNICLVYTKFNALSYGCKWSLFGVGLSLYMVWCTFSTQLDTLLLK